LFVTVFLFASHRSGGDRVTLGIWKRYHDAKKIAAAGGLPQYIVDRILSHRFATKNERAAKADLFNFVCQNSVLGYVLNSVIRPNQSCDLHKSTIPRSGSEDKISAKYYEKPSIRIRLIQPRRYLENRQETSVPM
jgi:hypothetical protein